MVRSRYFDPKSDAEAEQVLSGVWDVTALLEAVMGLSTGRGRPAAELAREDGSTLTIGTDGTWAVLIWVDSLGNSHHSAGQDRGSLLVYDYFGSWSEAPGDCQVRIEDAVEAMEQFVQHGTPATERVMFQSD